MVTDALFQMKDGKAVGPSLGVTIEHGAINRVNGIVDVRGTVVPSYTLNTVLDNVPILGEVLTGGEGKGVFAAGYHVKGHYPDGIEVKVNPLTMLTPGFLRGLVRGGKKRNAAVDTVPETEAVKPAPLGVLPPAPPVEGATPPAQ